MTRDELKQKLRTVYIIKERIKDKQNSIDFHRERIESITGQGSEVQSNSSKNRNEYSITIICDLEEEISKEISKMKVAEAELKNMFNLLDTELYKNILIARHIDCMTWSEVAYTVHYSTQHTRKRLYQKAFNELLKTCTTYVPPMTLSC